MSISIIEDQLTTTCFDVSQTKPLGFRLSFRHMHQPSEHIYVLGLLES